MAAAADAGAAAALRLSAHDGRYGGRMFDVALPLAALRAGAAATVVLGRKRAAGVAGCVCLKHDAEVSSRHAELLVELSTAPPRALLVSARDRAHSWTPPPSPLRPCTGGLGVLCSCPGWPGRW